MKADCLIFTTTIFPGPDLPSPRLTARIRASPAPLPADFFSWLTLNPTSTGHRENSPTALQNGGSPLPVLVSSVSPCCRGSVHNLPVVPACGPNPAKRLPIHTNRREPHL